MKGDIKIRFRQKRKWMLLKVPVSYAGAFLFPLICKRIAPFADHEFPGGLVRTI
jgi:hypothetical protein